MSTNVNMKPSAVVAIVGVIDPDVTVASTVTSAWIAAEDFYAFAAVIQTGTLGTGATIDAKFQQATNGSGAGAKDITGAAITQLTQAGSDSDKQALINLMQDELDVANDFNFIQLSVTVAVQTSDISAMVLGIHAAKGPASDNDASSVVELAN